MTAAPGRRPVAGAASALIVLLAAGILGRAWTVSRAGPAPGLIPPRPALALGPIGPVAGAGPIGVLSAETTVPAARQLTVPAGSRVQFQWLDDGRTRLVITPPPAAPGPLPEPPGPPPAPGPEPGDGDELERTVRAAIRAVPEPDRARVAAALAQAARDAIVRADQEFLTDAAETAAYIDAAASTTLGDPAATAYRPLVKLIAGQVRQARSPAAGARRLVEALRPFAGTEPEPEPEPEPVQPSPQHGQT